MVSKEKIKSFPDTPGVYLMIDSSGGVVYIGKAVSLRKRVASYFLKTQSSVKTKVMLAFVRDIRFIETASEYDALILESRLIKEHQPRFNISLKDDKSFPYIKITREKFPRVFIGRRRKKEEGVDLFGPYVSAKLLRHALNILRKSFPFRSCRGFGLRPCLNYDLKLCGAPCCGKVSQKVYSRLIQKFEDFLMKKDTEAIAQLSCEISRLAGKQEYEKAACLRDRLQALSILIFLKNADSRKMLKIYDDLGRVGLKKEPRRIETFDISNIGENFAVGSMVSFYDGLPDKDNYRRFKIRTVCGVDDYAMMREVVRRRYRRLKEEKAELPDLIVIDGGRGHLEAALMVLEEVGLKIPMIAIAKKEELIYTIKNKEGVKLERASHLLRLIQAGRDEAHRFALKYHQLLRKKNVTGNG